jgi:two-component system cell cycle response regulator
VLTPEGGLLYANPQAQLYLNVPEAPGGQSFLEIARRQYRCEPEAAWRLWEAGTPPSTPYYLVRPETPTARAFWLQVDELDLPQAAGLNRVVHLRNVTEAVTNQRDMRCSQSALIHKLRTPISNMYMSLYLLKQSAGQMPAPEAEILGLATDAFAGIERLNREMQDILEYIATPVLAQAGAQVTLAHLPETVASLAGSLQLPDVPVTVPPALQARHLTLTATALDSVLWELLENAKKYHPQQTPHVDVGVSAPPHDPAAIQLLVRDDGLALSPEQIEWAMTPYLQGEKHFTGEAPGMGLGLALVSTLVWQVGGRVRLTNRPDRPGVVVELSLPLAEG